MTKLKDDLTLFFVSKNQYVRFWEKVNLFGKDLILFDSIKLLNSDLFSSLTSNRCNEYLWKELNIRQNTVWILKKFRIN